MRPPLHLVRCLAFAATLLLALASAGCAARSKRAVMIDSYAGAYIHHHSAKEMVAVVERMLKERGFDVLPTQQGEAVRTEWKNHLGDEEFATAVERYIVVVHRLTKEHSRVTAIRLRFSTAGMETYHPRTPLKNDGKGQGHSVNTANYGKGWKPLMIGKPVKTRDLAFEWELIRRLDPNRARQIESMVDFELGRRPAEARASR
jgi:hypothetical protein